MSGLQSSALLNPHFSEIFSGSNKQRIIRGYSMATMFSPWTNATIGFVAALLLIAAAEWLARLAEAGATSSLTRNTHAAYDRQAALPSLNGMR